MIVPESRMKTSVGTGYMNGQGFYLSITPGGLE